MPRATTQAPVSVAISITERGLNFSAYVRASQRIKRPSASVFSTSMVWPDMLVTTSPGLLASPSGMFSQLGTIPTTLIAGLSSPRVLNAPKTLAAPHISNFISSIAGEGLMDIPPESKVMPLPTSTTGLAPCLPPLYSMIMNLGGWRLPRETDNKAPMPSFSISFCSRMRVFIDSYCFPSCLA